MLFFILLLLLLLLLPLPSLSKVELKRTNLEILE
jgi:hypothetical protein